MVGVISVTVVVMGACAAYFAERFPAHVELIETGGGALLIGGLALLGFALPPLLQLKNVPAVRVLRRELGPPRQPALGRVLAPQRGVRDPVRQPVERLGAGRDVDGDRGLVPGVVVGGQIRVPGLGVVLAQVAHDQVAQRRIVVRDRAGEIRVLLNSCSHKGRTVCVVDRGNSTGFTCSYHGWRYRSDGTLGGVPNSADGYLGELDKSMLGLVSARVDTYHGLIFATWEDRKSTRLNFRHRT